MTMSAVSAFHEYHWDLELRGWGDKTLLVIYITT